MNERKEEIGKEMKMERTNKGKEKKIQKKGSKEAQE